MAPDCERSSNGCDDDGGVCACAGAYRGGFGLLIADKYLTYMLSLSFRFNGLNFDTLVLDLIESFCKVS